MSEKMSEGTVLATGESKGVRSRERWRGDAKFAVLVYNTRKRENSI